MRIGAHLSVSKGLPEAARLARAIGANTFQYFTRNPRGGAARSIPPEEIAVWERLRQELDLFPVAAHLPYTVNLAAPKEETWDFARRVLLEDMRRAALCGTELVIVHPGSHLGEGVEAGMERIARAVAYALEGLGETPAPFLLLETMAGQGSEVGSAPEHLQRIISLLDNDPRLGVCLDTCHLYAAGYDISTKEGMDRTLAVFAEAVGLDRVRAVHLNDSRFGLGSHRDRHELLGRGCLGEEGLRAILTHPFIKTLPLLLETPVKDYTDYAGEIAAARRIAGQPAGMGSGADPAPPDALAPVQPAGEGIGRGASA